MSLKYAYHLQHTAECRFKMEVNRPERNLRFVVGHMMHYESLNLRIVEIEHDISRSQRAKAVQFRGTGHVEQKLPHKVSTGELRRRSPPPPVMDHRDENEDAFNGLDTYGEDDDEDAGLGLTRFPSAAAGAPPPPELEPDVADDDDDEDDDEPVSPEEPDQATLEQALKGSGNETLAKYYENTRRCPCHGQTASAERIERMWELPGEMEGVTRAVAEIAV